MNPMVGIYSQSDVGKPCYVDPDIWEEEGVDDICDGSICCAKQKGWDNCPYGGKFNGDKTKGRKP